MSWCDIAVSEWAHRSGNTAAVLLGGDRAYTVWHAEDFQKAGRWHVGTTAEVDRARPGDIVFFDWGATNSIGAIDHVGIVEKALGGGRVQTIEGNTGDACLRRVRSADVIAGYGRPKYDAPPPAMPDYWDVQSTVARRRVRVPWATPFLQRGSTGPRVKWLQDALLALGARLDVDGDFGPATEKALRSFQASHRGETGARLEADGVYGHHTARSLFIAHGGKKGDAV
ncbi:peptidoglycan-binding protein [Actinomadura litoris]|uniref:peptidoglycan-binding protein n=1 Tax=Actinomadura litoris TaxID=2678616 RepID=UPI001FA6F69C|nr:peptidoglycan-binding protein [Actinomadura litoris]